MTAESVLPKAPRKNSVISPEYKRKPGERAVQSASYRKPTEDLQAGLGPVISSQERSLLPVVQEGIKILEGNKPETFEERSNRLRDKRLKYAPMRAHMEMAAVVLAAGGSFKIAGIRAGVSTRQVKKYYQDAEFRARIEELRQTMFSKVRGRVIKELETRTEPGKIEQIELLDLLRVFDRVAGPLGGKAGVNIQGDVNVGTTQYDTIIAAVLAQNSPTEEPDFPIFELDGSAVPGEDPFQ